MNTSLVQLIRCPKREYWECHRISHQGRYIAVMKQGKRQKKNPVKSHFTGLGLYNSLIINKLVEIRGIEPLTL